MERADVESAPAGMQRNNLYAIHKRPVCSKKQTGWYVSALFLIAAAVVPAIGNSGSSQLQETRHAPHWGYSGQAGPSHWADMDGKFALCGSGKRQSPVDIRDANPQALYPLDFQYRPVSLHVLNNGHTLQANYNTASGDTTVVIGGNTYPLKSKQVYDSTLMLGDVPYNLLQFHFHSPSEHARDGRRFPMEVHLVHKNANGNLAVVGIFLKRGKHNPTLQKLLEHVPSTLNTVSNGTGITINATDLLPESRKMFHYGGSLTTPPCSENVNWFVMKTPIEVSDEQVRKFTQLIGRNARPLQQAYWRDMLVSE